MELLGLLDEERCNSSEKKKRGQPTKYLCGNNPNCCRSGTYKEASFPRNSPVSTQMTANRKSSLAFFRFSFSLIRSR